MNEGMTGPGSRTDQRCPRIWQVGPPGLAPGPVEPGRGANQSGSDTPEAQEQRSR